MKGPALLAALSTTALTALSPVDHQDLRSIGPANMMGQISSVDASRSTPEEIVA